MRRQSLPSPGLGAVGPELLGVSEVNSNKIASKLTWQRSRLEESSIAGFKITCESRAYEVCNVFGGCRGQVLVSGVVGVFAQSGPFQRQRASFRDVRLRDLIRTSKEQKEGTYRSNLGSIGGKIQKPVRDFVILFWNINDQVLSVAER